MGARSLAVLLRPSRTGPGSEIPAFLFNVMFVLLCDWLVMFYLCL